MKKYKFIKNLDIYPKIKKGVECQGIKSKYVKNCINVEMHHGLESRYITAIPKEYLEEIK